MERKCAKVSIESYNDESVSLTEVTSPKNEEEKLDKFQVLKKGFFAYLKDSIKLFSPKNVIEGIKRVKLSAYILALIIIVIFLVIDIVGLPLELVEPSGGMRTVYSIIISVIITILWFTVGTWLGPNLGKLLVTNKYIIKFWTKGNRHYFEKVTEEERYVKHSQITSKFIGLLIAWTSLAATFVSIWVGDGDIVEFVEDTSWVAEIIKFFLVFIISPLALTIFIPVSWMLLDVKLKAYHTGSKINWYVGKKVQQTLSSYVTIGAVIASASAIGFDKLRTVLDIFLMVFSWVGLACFLIVFLYSILFQIGYYSVFLNVIPVPYGETDVKLTEREILETENLEKEDIVEDEEELGPEIEQRETPQIDEEHSTDEEKPSLSPLESDAEEE
ncbi:MAG: hypothetical protein ACFFCQ_02020 [Promethearchaeota archaeon]